MMVKKNALIFIILIFSTLAIAREERYLGRSPRGLLMGDAYTAIADDAYTLFYNPALLARHKFFSLYPIHGNITASNILSDPDRFKNTSDDPSEFSDTAMDFPIHLGLGTTPGLKMANFGLSAIMTHQTNLILQNEVVPMLDIDYRFDKGFIAGYAFPISGKFKNGEGGEHFAFGFSLKYLKREGIYSSYNLTSTTMLDALDAGDIEGIMEGLGQVKGSGWGVDLGLDYAKSMGAGQTIMLSAALLDPYTLLHTEENDDDREVQPQPMQFNMGGAYRFDFGALLDATLSVDLRNYHQQKVGAEYLRDTRLGLDIGNPFLRVLAGYNGGHYSYGLKTSLGIIDLLVGFYDVEIGEQTGQQRSRRVLVYFSLFEFEFDP